MPRTALAPRWRTGAEARLILAEWGMLSTGAALRHLEKSWGSVGHGHGASWRSDSDMRALRHSDELPNAGGALPAFVERAKEDARCRVVLTRMGYRRVKRLLACQPR